MLCFCKKKREFTLCLMILTTTLKNKKSKYYNFNFSSKETGPERSRVTLCPREGLPSTVQGFLPTPTPDCPIFRSQLSCE